MYKVLVVEDDSSLLVLLAKVIRKEGFDVFTAKNGKMALEVFKKELPEIVITDLKMPESTGLELMHVIKQLSPDVQVILTTGYGEVDVAVEALREGALDYLKKPIDLNQLTIALGKAKKKIAKFNQALSFPAVLLAEDDSAFREGLAMSLEEEGWNVYRASDGEEAMKIFKEKKIDIALLDIRMPNKNGIETLNEMREVTDDFEAIVLTGYGDEPSAIEAMRSGAMNFLQKSVNLDETKDAIKNAVEKLCQERSKKYSASGVDAVKEIAAKVTVENGIVIDIHDCAQRPVMDYAKKLLDAMLTGIIVVDQGLKVLYVNSFFVKMIGSQPEIIDEEFSKKLNQAGIKDLSFDSLKTNLNKIFESPAGTLVTINDNKDMSVTLTVITIVNESNIKQKGAVISITRTNTD